MIMFCEFETLIMACHNPHNPLNTANHQGFGHMSHFAHDFLLVKFLQVQPRAASGL